MLDPAATSENQLWVSIAGIDLALSVLFTLIVLSRRQRIPSVTLSWILAFFLLPYVGVLAYLLVGYRKFGRKRRGKPNPAGRFEAVSASGSIAPEGELRDAPTVAIDFPLQNVARFAERLTDFPVIPGNEVRVLEESVATYKALRSAIEAAEHHVHLEYYIFQPDETGTHIRDLLIQKAKKGVECRLLVDHVGSFKLPSSFIRPLEDAGVRFAQFWPLKLTRPWSYHLRNHRKITVVDGKVGFVGSQNIGREYFSRRKRRLVWRDTMIEVRGPAVGQLQAIFSEDWDFTTGEKLLGTSYFPAHRSEGTTLVQALPSGPDASASALELILIELVHSAEERITIATPYFVPTLEIAYALEAAARRGVSVELLIPRRSDNLLVDWAARSWSRDLLDAGAHIFEYDMTFLHAKVMTVDGNATLLGSANMDERSFRLNFECTVLLYDSNITRELERSFESLRSTGSERRLRDVASQPFYTNIRDGALRILSPLL